MEAASPAATRKLFGTDGVRGVAGEFVTAELALALARAATARVQNGRHARVLVIRDTRESGEMLEAAVAAGIAAAGGDALLGGVLPTPGAPLLIARYGFDLAVVLSASHNPYQDNGIKFFGGDGFKLSDAVELEIEGMLAAPPASSRIGRVRRLHGALEDYLRALHERFADLDLSGRRILLDCANGATYEAGPEIFRRLGAHVDVMAAAPDGRNINAGCGSTHIEPLRAAMAEGRHDSGFAFDGDGDRLLAVDRTGTVLDGDELIALAAKHLGVSGVAVTVMTNYGFHAAMRRGRDRGRHHAGRRPLRPRGPARARLGARRRAVRPHHRHGVRALRGRHRVGAAGDGGARRRRPARASGDGEAPADAGQRPRARPRGARRAPPRSTRRSTARPPRSRAAAACCCGRAAPSRSCA